MAPFPDPSHYGWGKEETTEFALKRARLPAADRVEPGRDRGVLRRAGARRGRLRAREQRVLRRAPRARRPARHPAGRRRDPDRLGPHRASSGAATTSERGRHPHHRQGPRIRLPALGHRRPRRDDGQGLARIAGRHLRRERRRLRGGPRDPRRRSRRRTSSRTPRCRVQALRTPCVGWPTGATRSPTSAASA